MNYVCGSIQGMRRRKRYDVGKNVAVSIAHVCAWALLCMVVWHSGLVHGIGRTIIHAVDVQDGMYKASYERGVYGE